MNDTNYTWKDYSQFKNNANIMDKEFQCACIGYHYHVTKDKAHELHNELSQDEIADACVHFKLLYNLNRINFSLIGKDGLCESFIKVRKEISEIYGCSPFEAMNKLGDLLTFDTNEMQQTVEQTFDDTDECEQDFADAIANISDTGQQIEQ